MDSNQPDTPQGRRDQLLLCLLLEQSLMCGEKELLLKQYIEELEKEAVENDRTSS